jgi:hypothetical protein
VVAKVQEAGVRLGVPEVGKLLVRVMLVLLGKVSQVVAGVANLLAVAVLVTLASIPIYPHPVLQVLVVQVYPVL